MIQLFGGAVIVVLIWATVEGIVQVFSIGILKLIQRRCEASPYASRSISLFVSGLGLLGVFVLDAEYVLPMASSVDVDYPIFTRVTTVFAIFKMVFWCVIIAAWTAGLYAVGIKSKYAPRLLLSLRLLMTLLITVFILGMLPVYQVARLMRGD